MPLAFNLCSGTGLFTGRVFVGADEHHVIRVQIVNRADDGLMATADGADEDESHILKSLVVCRSDARREFGLESRLALLLQLVLHSVMVSALHDCHGGGIGLVNQPMFAVDASGPIAGPIVF